MLRDYNAIVLNGNLAAYALPEAHHDPLDESAMTTGSMPAPMGLPPTEFAEILEAIRRDGLPPETAIREPMPPPAATIVGRASVEQMAAMLELDLLRRLPTLTPDERQALRTAQEMRRRRQRWGTSTASAGL